MTEATHLSMPLLMVFAAVGLGLAATAPLYYLILFDLLVISIVDQWILGGTWVGPSDLILGCFALALVLRARFSPLEMIRKLPYLLPWLALGIMMSLSYVNSPENAENLTGPVRIAYQLYRYCWKPILYFPLCLLVFSELKQARHAWLAILIGGDICAGQAVWQGYHNVYEPPGPFVTGNSLAAVLVVPLVVSVSGLAFPASRFQRLISGASLLLIARAILFSASRGGMVSMIIGAGFLCGLAMTTANGRHRVLKLLPVVLVSVVALLAVRPDILDRPTVRHAFTVLEGTQTANMQWRIHQRWPHFLRIATAHPILGTGTHVDPTLSDDANTPHNGYIALAVKYGFPVLGLVLLLLFRLLRNGLLAFRRAKDFEERIFGLTLAAAALGLAAHNVVESTFTNFIILKFFLMLCAFAVAYQRLWQPSTAGAGSERMPAAARNLTPSRQPA